jgi:hypothetical protein
MPPTATLAPTLTATPDPAVLAATEAAQAQAEVAAIALIEPDLEDYGFSTEQGRLGWAHEPVSLNLEKYQEVQLDISQGSTNRVAVVGQGNQFTTYVNGVDAGSVAHAGLRSGAVGLLARQESGKTTCTFENAWLWILDN